TFPGTVTGEDVFDFLATFESYDILPRPGGGNPIDIQRQRDALDKLGELMLQFQAKADAIDYVLLNKEQFADFDSAKLVEQRTKLVGAINQLTDQASKCFNDRSECKLPTLSADPAAVTLPERLSRTDIGAIQVANQAALDAQGHAAASKAHAARVLEISR